MDWRIQEAVDAVNDLCQLLQAAAMTRAARDLSDECHDQHEKDLGTCEKCLARMKKAEAHNAVS